MTSAGLHMFMEKLNHLIINSNHIPSINNQETVREAPQFQLLYDELGSMFQTLFIHEHRDLEKVNDLKRRFTDTAEEAEYIVDLFLSGVQSSNKTEDLNSSLNLDNARRPFKPVVDLFLCCFHIRDSEHCPTYGDLKHSLNLDDVRRSLKSVEVEFMSMNIDSNKMDSSPRPQTTLNQSIVDQSSISINSPRSKKLLGENFVGLDRDVELIRDNKLVEDLKKVDVVSIVGMGGIGKTTLATKLFNDGFVKHHFYVRVWVTVSQTYDKRGVLTQILDSICAQLDLEKATDSRLRELVHKNLIGKRYLIVIDDIWQTETWDNLKLFFPNDNNGSRIMLTSRHTEVARHANANGLIHHLGYLNKEEAGSCCVGWSLMETSALNGRLNLECK